MMEAVRERLTFEDVTELFDRPGTAMDFCRRFSDLMIERLPIAACAVAFGPRKRPEVVFAASRDAGAEAARDGIVPDESVLDTLYRGEPVADGATLYLPLASANGPGGFTALIGSSSDFDGDDVVKLHSFGRVFALAMDVAHLSAEVERLAERSTNDALTGVLNRRGFDERMRLEWRRSVRERAPIAVALLDIDYFRGYNEACGRDRGDDCLKHIARAIVQAGLRAGDFVARYSGEEFAVVMPNADETGALALCDRIRTFVALRSIEHPASPHRIVTISAGVAAAVPEPGVALSTLLYRADTNLYRAKSAGRNRVAGDHAIRSSPLRAVRLQLPSAAHAFVGRSEELETLATTVRPVVTVTGPAGIGKSALALEFARRSQTHALFVDLTDCRSDDEVGAYVARALTADPSGAAQLLLVLDGCDAVSGGVAAYVRGASNAVGMHIVATCREPLGVDDEFILKLAPFSSEEGVKFYEGCVLEYAGGAEVEQEDAATIRRRVEELRAIPGAIELDVFARRFRLLSTPEQRVLLRMAVFHRDCSWEAARAVCGDGSGELLQRLCDASLLLIEATEPPRLRVPETLREFLREQLRRSGDRDAALRDFARYFASPVGSMLRHNVDAALDWAMDENEYELVADLLARQDMSYVRGQITEAAIRRISEVAARAGDSGAPVPKQLHALAIAAHAAFVVGDFPSFKMLSERLEARSNTTRDPYVWFVLAKRAIEEEGQLERASDFVRSGLALASAGEDDQLLCALRVIQANVSWRRGDEEEAAALFGRIVRALRAGDFHYGFESVMLRSARFELSRNNVDDALARLLDVLRALRRQPKIGATAGVLDAYVEAACRRDKRDIGIRLHAFTEGFHAKHVRMRSPSAQAAYTMMAAQHDLPLPAPNPDLGSVEEAFELALTI
jgi:diguanylate cyclase (GGDEF)-like protein